MPRSPLLDDREALRPQRGQAAKYTRPSMTLGAPWIADEAWKRHSRSPVAALNAMNWPSYVPM